MRIGVDAMGGDLAPAEPVKGALAARKFLGEGDEVVLIGDEPCVRSYLDSTPDWREFIRVEHAPEVVGMSDVPVETLRQKPNSSIARMAELASRGEVNAVISAGNTGACVAACQMRLRRLRGVIDVTLLRTWGCGVWPGQPGLAIASGCPAAFAEGCGADRTR